MVEVHVYGLLTLAALYLQKGMMMNVSFNTTDVNKPAGSILFGSLHPEGVVRIRINRTDDEMLIRFTEYAGEGDKTRSRILLVEPKIDADGFPFLVMTELSPNTPDER